MQARHRTVSAMALPSVGRGGGVRPPALAAATLRANLVAVTAVSGGLGASTVSAMLAAELDRRGRRCTLVDADFGGGGLDVLLGLEGESGLRFETVEAPLGRIDGGALAHELPQWGRIGVLACNPWSGDAPGSWEVEAVLHALCESSQAVVVDAGHGPLGQRLPGVAAGVQVVAVELSVLGLARAKVWLERVPGTIRKRTLLVGIHPHGAGGKGVVSGAEAEDYLDAPLEAWVRYDRHLHDDMLQGLGLRALRGRNRRAIRRLTDSVESMMVRGGGDG